MKKILLISLILLLLISSVPFLGSTADAVSGSDVRAVWIATVYNSDFPSVKNNVSAQKEEFKENLKLLKEMGVNTIFVQVRPKADALYESDINPWSDVLTGVQGKDPGYDPLSFMIEEAHSLGISIHAWLNPYRVTTSGTDISVLSPENMAYKHPEWTIAYGDKLYFNPDLNEVKEYIRDTVKEIVDNYDVDGIHFDDYFYPSDYPLPTGETRDGATASSRRGNITDMVKMVSDVVKAAGKEFGISPTGVLKNEYTGKYGSIINGRETYYQDYADVETWVENGYVDYIAPQVYWEIGNANADYSTMIKYWSDIVKGSSVKLYIGEGIYKEAVSSEINTHFKLCASISNISGNVFYSLKTIKANLKGVKDSIKAYYASKDKNTETKVEQKTALYSKSPVYVDEKLISFEAYNIDGYNYFKLRDVAMSLSGSQNTFDTIWNEADQAITLKFGSSYTSYGGELEMGNGENKLAQTSTAKLIANGETKTPSAYNINGNNYFKLRDLGDIVGFGVDYDSSLNAVYITTK
ncbi:MAG: family 10 glycosylhydrolase [Lachnospiraceae bacterium]|nr:family 10 glycosylhydrolase [Lachnospiraceae bacterium]